MAYRAGVVGGSGYTGAELLRLLAGHPEIEVVHVTADSQRGRGGRRAVSRRCSPAYERPRATRRSTPPTSPASTSCSPRCRTARARRCCPDLLDHVGHVIDLGADFRLPADVYAHWYGEAHHAPDAVDRFAYGLVELYRDEIAPHAHVAVARLLPDRGEPRVRAAARARARRAAASSPTRCRACRARAAA